MAGTSLASERDLLDYLLTNVRPTEGCRVWAGAIDTQRRPRITVGYKPQSARRLLVRMLLEAYGETLGAAQRVYVRSVCHYPKTCMALEHLLVGTNKQAVEAAKKRGAYQRGVDHSIRVALGKAPRARLPIHARHDVTGMLAAGMGRRDIGVRYGVSASAVGGALRRWRRAGLITG